MKYARARQLQIKRNKRKTTEEKEKKTKQKTVNTIEWANARQMHTKNKISYKTR